LVVSGVGGVETDGTGAIVGDVVCVGGAVGAAAGGEAAGVAAALSVGLTEDVAGPGRTCRAGEPATREGWGDVLPGAADSLGAASRPTVRVRLNPASATAIASDGPMSTYNVKEARPAWPKARSLGFPSRPPTALVGTSYPPARLDK